MGVSHLRSTPLKKVVPTIIDLDIGQISPDLITIVVLVLVTQQTNLK